MELTKEEEDILNHTGSKKKPMEIIVTLGNIFGADRLIKVSSCQISGASYKTIGMAGLKFLEDWVKRGARVSVPSTLNPVGMPMDGWKKLGISSEFARFQKRIVNAYKRMGVTLSLTCTPYLSGNKPEYGQHIAWSESSAMIYANSVLGARTNRESGISALASAIIGKTPNYGLHREENRVGEVKIRVNGKFKAEDYSVLGYIIGEYAGNRIPYIEGIKPDRDELKAMGAAMAATGGMGMYHIPYITREWRRGVRDGAEKITIDRKDIKETMDSFNINNKKPEIIAIGCPHCSCSELKKIAMILRNSKRKKTPWLWVCTSREVKRKSKKYLEIIEKYGNVITDTCMVVAPIEEIAKSIGTNSTKALIYLKQLCGQEVCFGSLKDLLHKWGEE